MLPLMIVLAAIVILAIAYVTYGSWLAKEFGIDPSRKTPAVELEDDIDYCPAKPIVLMGHHFSSIAGAGPINGPIQASVFGWVPVFLWCVLGGIFFGGLQDFGSLFASIRSKALSIGEIIRESMGKTAQRLFTIFALLVLILVIANFANVVAGTFYTAGGFIGITTHPDSNQTTAMVSLLFIVIAILYGVLTNRMGLKTLPASIIGVIAIAAIIVFGLNVGFVMGRTAWIVVIGIYIAVASLVPVWILLQPRDYLSSFLLYAMMAVALIGIFVAAFTGSASFELPAFTSWNTSIGPLFPVLFITVACGACSGFHSLISTGTTSKQLNNEKNAKPIAYGSMLIESVLGVISMIAVGMVFTTYVSGGFGSPSAAFGAGIALMYAPEGTVLNSVINALLTLTVSVFALTSLDTAARLSRFMFTELFLKADEGSYKDAKGIRRILAHPYFGTAFMVITGCAIGGLSLSEIWSLFGAANQLLAGLALMGVAAWLGNIGKNNKMFFIPTIFMLCATLTYLLMTAWEQAEKIMGGGVYWGDWFKFLFAAALAILAIILAIQGIVTFVKQHNQKAQNA